jgi:hypothetical protein
LSIPRRRRSTFAYRAANSASVALLQLGMRQLVKQLRGKYFVKLL